MANQLTRYATVATVDTAGEGYFVGGTISLTEGLGGLSLSAVNQTRVHQFVLPFRVVVGQISYWVSTGGGAGKKLGFGIYDVAKNLLLESGAVDANVTGQATASITAVTLEPGVYWLAWTSDSGTVEIVAIKNLNNAVPIINEITPRSGIAANASSAGVLPATLGTITASVNRGIAQVIFGR